MIMMTSVSLCIQVAPLLLAFVSSADELPRQRYLSKSCKETCEKYRITNDAFALDCDDHKEDLNCQINCWYCKEMCADQTPRKVYSCPAISDNQIDKKAYIATIIYLVISGFLFFAVVGGILCSVFITIKQRGPRGSRMGVAPMHPDPESNKQETMHHPTMGTMYKSAIPYSQQQHHHHPLSSESSGSTSGSPNNN